jgi:RNA polymerase sigma factor for flagellar operon FliA
LFHGTIVKQRETSQVAFVLPRVLRLRHIARLVALFALAWPLPFSSPRARTAREREEITRMQSATAIIVDTAPFVASMSRRTGLTERDERIKAHLHIVRSVARAIRLSSLGKGVEMEDLVGYGAKGLVEAAARFDGGRGIPFVAFARHRIRGAILDGIRTEHWLGRRAYERLQSDPTAGHVQFVELGERAEAPEGARWNGRHMAQLPCAEDDSLEVLVTAALDRLPERERRLIELCYFEGKTLEQAAAMMGFRRSWASRLVARALVALRTPVEKAGPLPTVRLGSAVRIPASALRSQS